MGKFRFEAVCITHIGLIKKSNEDNYYVNGKYMADSSKGTEGIADRKPRNSCIYAVCDGMGGEGYGEMASLIAVATLEKFKEKDIRQAMPLYVKTANEFICDLVRKNRKVRIGSTIALLSIQNDTAVAFNIGDSRVYLCRKGCLYQMTTDDVDGTQKSNLTQYLGIPSGEQSLAAHKSAETKVKKGDVFMLCSDGLFDVVSNEDIVELLSDDSISTADLTKKLVSAAQDNNGIDNVTVIVVKAS